jgi:predicted acyltransferase
MIKEVSSAASLPVAASQKRVLSIDVLRGLTIALMILVNDPGDWDHVYTQLDHAPWNGFTLADLVFPTFLFIVGASIILSLRSRIARANFAGAISTLDLSTKKNLALHIIRRAAIIFAIGLFLAAFPRFDLTHLRLFGVLPRIAICYLIAGLICLYTQRPRNLIAITATLLIGYWALMRLIPVPGHGIPTLDIPILDQNRNLAAWLDRTFNAFTQRYLHTGILYERTRDPEGLLSTIPAIATTLIGSITALWLSRVATPLMPSSRPERSGVERPPHFASAASIHSGSPITLALAGLTCVIAGLLWNITFPINKNLWTSSYVLFSAGLSLLLLALCYWLIDVRRLNETKAGKWLIAPWLIFGSNAITAYVISALFVEIMLWIRVPANSVTMHGVYQANPRSATVWLWTYRWLFARGGSTHITSLIFAIAFVAVCFIPNWLLWRKRIFIRV